VKCSVKGALASLLMVIGLDWAAIFLSVWQTIRSKSPMPAQIVAFVQANGQVGIAIINDEKGFSTLIEN
jgi:hypothetical protein